MAPLPPQSTCRVFFDYITSSQLGVEHTLQFRYNGTDRSAQSAQDTTYAFLNAIGAANLRVGWKMLRCRTALAGERFTSAQVLSSNLTTFVGTNSGGFNRERETEEWTWQGRGVASPRRVDVSLYGIHANVPPLLRYTPGGTSPTWVLGTINALKAAGSPFVAIDGTAALWYSYVNLNRNSYWERRIRLS